MTAGPQPVKAGFRPPFRTETKNQARSREPLLEQRQPGAREGLLETATEDEGLGYRASSQPSNQGRLAARPNAHGLVASRARCGCQRGDDSQGTSEGRTKPSTTAQGALVLHRCSSARHNPAAPGDARASDRTAWSQIHMRTWFANDRGRYPVRMLVVFIDGGQGWYRQGAGWRDVSANSAFVTATGEVHDAGGLGGTSGWIVWFAPEVVGLAGRARSTPALRPGHPAGSPSYGRRALLAGSTCRRRRRTAGGTMANGCWRSWRSDPSATTKW